MSYYNPQDRRKESGVELRGEWRQERMREAAAKREIVREAKRGSDGAKQSGLARIIARFGRKGR